jgi:hypothetical protein
MQTCHPKGKTYRDTQLREPVHSVVVEQLPEHKLAYGSEPSWERGEGEAVAEQQPPRASGWRAKCRNVLEGGLLSSWHATSKVASTPATTDGVGTAPAVRWG